MARSRSERPVLRALTYVALFGVAIVTLPVLDAAGVDLEPLKRFLSKYREGLAMLATIVPVLASYGVLRLMKVRKALAIIITIPVGLLAVTVYGLSLRDEIFELILKLIQNVS